MSFRVSRSVQQQKAQCPCYRKPRKEAADCGAWAWAAGRLRRVPALDIDPTFISCLADLVQQSMAGPEVNLDQAATLSTTVKLYPQDKWAWGWNNSSEVWNGRLAMVGFSAFLLELLSGRGPLHAIGLL